MIKIFGIKNCDTMEKAFKWLDENNIEYSFHDYKKEQPDQTILKNAITQHGWDSVINRRGTTWRKLPDDIKESMDESSAIAIALDNPSIIKRPLLLHNDNQTELGFKPESYAQIFSA